MRGSFQPLSTLLIRNMIPRWAMELAQDSPDMMLSWGTPSLLFSLYPWIFHFPVFLATLKMVLS